jgi:hypothetical protein
MLQTFTRDTFSGRLGERFRLHLDSGATLDLSLAQFQDLGPKNTAARPEKPARTPFSVVFLGPPDPLLPQRIYRFEHEQLGFFEIFIVPVGRDQAGARYEAIFT